MYKGVRRIWIVESVPPKANSYFHYSLSRVRLIRVGLGLGVESGWYFSGGRPGRVSGNNTHFCMHAGG